LPGEAVGRRHKPPSQSDQATVLKNKRAMQNGTEPMPTFGHDDIAKAAWNIWQQEGRPEGRDQEHWLKAEQQLLMARNGRSGPPLNPVAAPKVSTLRRTARRRTAG